MTILKLIIPVTLAITLSSCEKTIEAKNLPEQDPMIVLNSILSTDESIQVSISQSKSILSGKDYKYINNAVCELYEDGVFVQNLSFSSNGGYFGSAIPKPNRKYTVKVAASGFESVTATTTMPADFIVKPIEKLDTIDGFYRSSFTGQDPTITGENKFRIRIVDDPKNTNYYSIKPQVFLLDSLDQIMDYKVDINLYTYDNNALGGYEYYDDAMEIDDKTIVNGNEVLRNIGVRIHATEKATGPRVKTIVVDFKIMALSKDYFQYKQTLLNQAYTGPSLFAEPVQVYTNVEKGIGILAGVNATVLPAFTGILEDF